MKLKAIIFLLIFAILPPLVVWMPFFFQFETFWALPIPAGGMQTVISNYDGPLYIVVANSMYNLDFISQNFALDLPVEYFAAHFPFYPLLIKMFGLIVGNPWGMLLSTMLGSIVSMFYFYKLASLDLKTDRALILTMIFAFFPARWLIVRSVGSPEPIFIGSILASIYYFNERKYWKSGLWGVVAQLTKSPGILLFVALVLAVAFKDLKKLASTKQSIRKWFGTLNYNAYPIALIPLSLLGLFIFYGLDSTFGNFFAYFNSGDNIHLFFPPFQIFNYTQPWVNTFWLEEILFIYAIILVGIFKLIKTNKNTMAVFVMTFFATIIFVSHRDILRYSLPVIPFVILAFHKELTSREAQIIFILMAIPTLLFTIAYISGNVMPIADWTPYL